LERRKAWQLYTAQITYVISSAHDTDDEHAAEAWWQFHGPSTTSVNVREAGPPFASEPELFWSVDADCFDGTEEAGASSVAGFGRK
jgi:hypothetical protein